MKFSKGLKQIYFALRMNEFHTNWIKIATSEDLKICFSTLLKATPKLRIRA